MLNRKVRLVIGVTTAILAHYIYVNNGDVLHLFSSVSLATYFLSTTLYINYLAFDIDFRGYLKHSSILNNLLVVGLISLLLFTIYNTAISALNTGSLGNAEPLWIVFVIFMLIFLINSGLKVAHRSKTKTTSPSEERRNNSNPASKPLTAEQVEKIDWEKHS